MACAGLDLMTKPKLLREVKAEYRERLAGRKYKSPIPPDLKPPLNQF